MTILDAFAGYLQTVTFDDAFVPVLTETLFIGSAPSTDRVAGPVAWLRANGGAPTSRLLTGEQVKGYQVQVYFRDQSSEAVYQRLFRLEEVLNGARRIPLDPFVTYSVSASTFPVDQDIDDQDQSIGLLEATLVIYREQLT